MRTNWLFVLTLGILLVANDGAAATNTLYAAVAEKVLRLQALERDGATLTGSGPKDREMQRLHNEVQQLVKSWPGPGVAKTSSSAEGDGILKRGQKEHQEQPGAAKTSSADGDGILKRGQKEYQEQQGIAPKPPQKKEAADFCDPKNNLYVRADRLDTYLYGIQSLDAAKGASVSFTNDNTNGHRTTSISGVVSYVLFRDLCRDPPNRQLTNDIYLSGYAIAPWIYANGTLNNFSPTTEHSSLQYGLDAQYAWIGGTIFDAQYLIVSPYYQTDFHDQARVYGLTASWQPLSADWHLGGALGRGNDYLYWFWQFVAEADFRKVDVQGLTQLTRSNYEWLGTTTRVHFFLLPAVFNRRVHATGTLQAYWDARSSHWIHYYVAALAYNFTDDGNASISVEYDKGTQKDNLAQIDQYLVKFNVKY